LTSRYVHDSWPRTSRALGSRNLFGDMSMTNESPFGYPPGQVIAASSPAPSVAGSFLAAGLTLGGSVVAGLLGGLIWGALAPEPVYVVVSRGEADVVNPETSTFITGDLCYCLIALIGGLIIGIVSYRLAVRKYGPLPMAAVLAGSVIAALTARWAGQSLGLAQFNAKLATSHVGVLLHAPPVLGANGPAILWPAIAFWPLAACAVPAALTLLAAWRDRPAVAGRPARFGS
jgi:hypothetical protein